VLLSHTIIRKKGDIKKRIWFLDNIINKD
jgi:hypothetical protein